MGFGDMKAKANLTGGTMKPSCSTLKSVVGGTLGKPEVAAGRSKGRKSGGR